MPTEHIGLTKFLKLIAALACALAMWAGCESEQERIARNKLHRAVKKLQSHDVDVAVRATYTIGNDLEMRVKAVPALVEALKREEPEVRGAAAFALSARRTPSLAKLM